MKNKIKAINFRAGSEETEIIENIMEKMNIKSYSQALSLIIRNFADTHKSQPLTFVLTPKSKPPQK